MFDNVDKFVSPSDFLVDRYVDWGLPKEKITMIENGQPKANFLPPRQQAKGECRGRFAFFGQVNPFKGIDVLLQAFSALPEKIKQQVHLDIHGANLEHQTGEFKEKVKELLEELEGTVTMHGSYEPHEMPGLLAQAEKIKDGETGILFRTKNPVDLASKIKEVVSNSTCWKKYVDNIQVPITIEECADIHLKEVY